MMNSNRMNAPSVSQLQRAWRKNSREHHAIKCSMKSSVYVEMWEHNLMLVQILFCNISQRFTNISRQISMPRTFVLYPANAVEFSTSTKKPPTKYVSIIIRDD